MEDTQYSTSADLSHHPLALLPFFCATSTPLAGPGTEEDTIGKQFLLMSKLRDMATLLRSSCCGPVRAGDLASTLDGYGPHITTSSLGL